MPLAGIGLTEVSSTKPVKPSTVTPASNQIERPKTGATMTHRHFDPVRPVEEKKQGPPSISGSTVKIIDVDSGLKLDEDEDEGPVCCVQCCAPEVKPWKGVLKLCACACAGVVFGWCFEKSRGGY